MNEQLRKFRDLRKRLAEINIVPPLVHIANTGGCLNYDVSDFTLSRPGSGVYGVGDVTAVAVVASRLVVVIGGAAVDVVVVGAWPRKTFPRYHHWEEWVDGAWLDFHPIHDLRRYRRRELTGHCPIRHLLLRELLAVVDWERLPNHRRDDHYAASCHYGRAYRSGLRHPSYCRVLDSSHPFSTYLRKNQNTKILYRISF